MRGLVLAFFLLYPLALAQQVSSTPLTLAQALELAPPNDPDVITAQADLVAAERALSRQLADPLALEIGDLGAASVAEAAQAALASARLTSRGETSALFFAVLSAEAAGALATKTLTLGRSSRVAAQIRAAAGAASELELLQAENSFAEAQRAEAGADEASLLAYRELADATALSTTELLLRGLAPAPITQPPLPTLAASLARAQGENADVAAARTAVRMAKAQLEASDTIFSARVAVEAAADEVTRAESALAATLRQLTLSVRSAHSDLTSAVRAWTEAQATRRAYARELEAQRLRLQAGAISKSDFGEAEVTDLANVQAVSSAFYNMRLNSLTLEGAVVGSGGVTGSTVSGSVAPTEGEVEGTVSEDDIATKAEDSDSSSAAGPVDSSSGADGASSETGTEDAPP